MEQMPSGRLRDLGAVLERSLTRSFQFCYHHFCLSLSGSHISQGIDAVILGLNPHTH